MSLQACVKLEASTQAQSQSESWHHERKLRITASVIKEVCYRKATTSCEVFVWKKLTSKSIDTPSIRHGKHHKAVAVKPYICGLSKQTWHRNTSEFLWPISRSIHALASCKPRCHCSRSYSGSSEERMFGGEVSLRHVKKLFAAAWKDVPGFCLVLVNTEMPLSKTHSYFYQVQTQMHVTHLSWCDFVVWSTIQDLFVERVYYDPVFMKAAVLKA